MGNEIRRNGFVPVPRAPTQPGAVLDVLFISRYETDGTALAKALTGMRWHVLRVRTAGEALATLDVVLVPVVICDVEVEGDWKQIVDRVTHSRHPAPVIVASGSGDWHLWEEVIDRGGFDLLHKPFEQPAVTAMLDAALHHWETGRIWRTWDRMEPRKKASGA